MLFTWAFLNITNGKHFNNYISLFSSSFSAEFSMRIVLSSRTQNRIELKIVNISFPQVGIEATACRVFSRTLVAEGHKYLIFIPTRGDEIFT